MINPHDGSHGYGSRKCSPKAAQPPLGKRKHGQKDRPDLCWGFMRFEPPRYIIWCDGVDPIDSIGRAVIETRCGLAVKTGSAVGWGDDGVETAVGYQVERGS